MASVRLELSLAVVVVLMMMVPHMAEGHGYVLDPPQRSSMWRAGYETPVNYGDNQLFCGGFAHQWNVNGGKCGICGDPYDHPHPRPNEAGGEYASGIIVKTYQQGDVIDVTVRITANHLGYFIFKLCPNNDVTKEASQDCLDNHVLQVVDSEGRLAGNKFIIDSAIGLKYVRLKLPSDVTCTQCVLQWTYNTGNNWGCDGDTGSCCIGCGLQENFVNCVDIAIKGKGGDDSSTTTEAPTPTTTPKTPTTTEKPKEPATTTTTKPDPTLLCRAVGAYEGAGGMDEWCTTNCLSARPNCPETHCLCE